MVNLAQQLQSAKSIRLSVIIGNQSRFESDGYGNLSAYQHESVDVKDIAWFERHIGEYIFGSTLNGDFGWVKITDRQHAVTLSNMQTSGFKFIIFDDRKQQLNKPAHYPIIETFDDYEWLKDNRMLIGQRD